MNPSDLLAAFAAAFNQETRLISLQLGDGNAWGEQLLPQSVTGQEGINQPYCYQVECLSPDGNVELKSLLGLPVVLSIQDSEGGQIERCGVVSQAQLLGADGGFAKYSLKIEPPFALLRHRRTSRVFQDLSVPDMVKQVLGEHQANNSVFAAVQTLDFKLSAQHPPRSYCLQYRESDYDFLVRLLHEEGLAWRFAHLAGDSPQVQLVVFDDAFAIPEANDSQVRFHRADATEERDALTEWTSQRQVGSQAVSLASFDYKAANTSHTADESAIDQGNGGSQLQSTFEDYDPQSLYYASDAEQLSRYAQLRQQAHDGQKKSFSGSGTLRSLQAGQWFRLEDHPAHEWDSAEQREFAITELTFSANNNLPHDLTQQLHQIAPSLLGSVSQSATGFGKNNTPAPYQVEFTAQRRGQPITPSFNLNGNDSEQLAKPKSRGVQTATVVGPAGEEIHTDESGRIKVQFHWQRQSEHADFGANLDDKSSCWIRVAYPSAGASWGHQFIPRIGQEVLVDFIEGDIDRPIVTGVVYNGSHPTSTFSGAGALPANKTLSGIKSKEYKGGQYGELLFDDSTGQVRTKLSSEHAKTQLNLGYLIHPRSDGKGEVRGEGAELRTDAAMALRAAQGMLLTTYGKLQASDNQLARDELLQLLDQCGELFKSLGDYAGSHQALPVEKKPQQELVQALKDWENGSNTLPKGQNGGKPTISVVSPEGLSFATPKTIVSYAGLNYDLTAQKNLQFTSGERFSLNSGQGISLFAQSKDVRVIAHQGQCLFQAQSNDIVAQAEKNIRISATEGEVVIMAPKIRLIAEDGSFIKIGGGITLGTNGAVQIKAASKSMSGPATDSVNLPTFEQGKADQKFLLHYPGEGSTKPQIAANRSYEITLNDGSIVKGKSDANGKTDLLEDTKMQIAQIRVLTDKL